MDTQEKTPRTSFSQRVLIGAVLGVGLGLFVGERAAPLQVVGDVYVGLLQMTVLPYIVVALIANIGRLSAGGGKRFMRIAGLVVVGLWGIGLLAIPMLTLCYPGWEVGSFFSASLLEPTAGVDFKELYIPSNPFYSLANSLVPAVALFCILAGVVAIGMPGKERLIELLDLVSQLLVRLNKFVVKLTPFGVFGIAAAASGTLTLQQFGLLQGYLISHAIGVSLLVFGVLPLAVSCVTPLGYREVMRAGKEPLLTAFITGSTFVTLPMIVDNARSLLAEKGLSDGEVGPEVIVPLGYPFPHLGKLLALLFVPFAAWFYGSPMEIGDFPGFLASGLFGSFGSLVVTIPMLLEQQQLPVDIFQLFLLSGVIAARVSDMLGSMHLLAFALVTTCWVAGARRFDMNRFIAGSAIVAAAAAVLIGGTRVYLASSFVDEYARKDLLGTMVSVEPRAKAVELSEAAPNPVALAAGQSRLERIRQRGVLRVGIADDNLPFAFRNSEGALVGFDIDMAHWLALDLGVDLELVPVDESLMEEQLERDCFDLAMGGIESTVGRSEHLYLSDSYWTVTAAAVVRDHRLSEFENIDRISSGEGLRVAVVQRGYASENVFRRVPDAEIVEISSPREFFESNDRFDVLVVSAESGSAWTLRYPKYAVIKPPKARTQVPLVYPIAGRDAALREFVNHWVQLRRGAGLVDRLHDYWVLGQGAEVLAPRWCVLRDVLGWVD